LRVPHRIVSCISASQLPTQALNAEPERQVLARPVDDEAVWVLDAVGIPLARDIPHRALVALADPFPFNSASLSAVRRMCTTGDW